MKYTHYRVGGVISKSHLDDIQQQKEADQQALITQISIGISILLVLASAFMEWQLMGELL